MKIRRVNIGESHLYKEVRLESLRESPEAFLSTYESSLERSEDSWKKQSDSTAVGSDRSTFLVFDKDTPVGLAALYRAEDLSENGELLQVWISPRLRGSNVAVDLMDAAFAWARSNRFKNITAEVNVNNERAFKFYRKYGFEINRSSSSETVILTKQVEPLGGTYA